jgi:eukaryotic-like serine/threonine-protein kinase
MPAPASVPEFLDLVRRSNLLPEARLDEVLDRHRGVGTLPQSVDSVANLLVRESLLTFFQAKQLKLGRYKRFTIGTKYRLLELIGAGGMGAVYLCEHTLMRRMVALKVLPVEKLEDKSNEDRFYREARAIAALDHPNIVRAYDIDHYEKLHFLVMEYVDGTSLQEIVARYIMEKKQFDPIRAAHYIAQSAVGMQHGHELGMVHRDIKPGNVLLDRSGVIKVLDMGLARFFNKQQDTVTEKYDDKCVLGTADYLAPEQAVSNIVDIRADIYALGGTLYFMLTGQTPFPDGTIAAKLVAHQTKEPRPVESFRSDVPPGILAVLRKMMAKEPIDRYQEPIQVADALAEWADTPITPPPLREMPIHCPLVQSLAGPNAGGSASNSPLARALFGPGRGVFTRSGAGSGIRSGSQSKVKGASTTSAGKKGPGSTGSYSSLGNGSNPNFPRSGSIPGAPISTARSSSSQTAPISVPSPNQPQSGVPLDAFGNGTQPASGSVVILEPRRTGLYIIIGVLFALLFAVGAVAAYYIGKEKKDPRPTTDTSKSQEPGGGFSDAERIAPPTLDEPALSPSNAAAIPHGTVILIEFKVQSTGGQSIAHLNSSKKFTDRGNFAVHIAPLAYKEAGKTLEEIFRSYDGKTIRVRGKLTKEADQGTAGIDVKSLQQILVVPEK